MPSTSCCCSPLFSNSKRYPTLLRYVVEQTLEGRGDEIKERSIGIDVFGRPPDYDTNLDTIVRYTAGRGTQAAGCLLSGCRRSPYPDSADGARLPCRVFAADRGRPPASSGGGAPSQQERRDVVAGRIGGGPGVGPGRILCVGPFPQQRYKPLLGSPPLTTKPPPSSAWAVVVVSPGSRLGTSAASDVGGVNPYLSFENGLAMGRAAALLNALGGSYRVQPSSFTTLAEIRRESHGAGRGFTTMTGPYRGLRPCAFTSRRTPTRRLWDAQTPGRRWIRDGSRPFNEAPDYALVARFRNPSTDSKVVLIAGLQRFGDRCRLAVCHLARATGGSRPAHRVRLGQPQCGSCASRRRGEWPLRSTLDCGNPRLVRQFHPASG